MTARQLRPPSRSLLAVGRRCSPSPAGAISFSTALLHRPEGNPVNSLASSGYFGFFASGFYLGNSVDNRAIIGVGFRPDVVIVKGDTAQTAAVRTSTMSGDAAKPMTGPPG